jgi:hypothetical protein
LFHGEKMIVPAFGRKLQSKSFNGRNSASHQGKYFGTRKHRLRPGTLRLRLAKTFW